MGVDTSVGGVEAGGTGLVPLWLDPARDETLTVQVPSRLVRALDARARLHGRSRSAEMRLALSLWIENGGGSLPRIQE